MKNETKGDTREEETKDGKNHPNSKRLNYFLTTEKAEAEGMVIDLELTDSGANTEIKILAMNSLSRLWWPRTRLTGWLTNNSQFETTKNPEATTRKIHTCLDEVELKLPSVKWIKRFKDRMRIEHVSKLA